MFLTLRCVSNALLSRRLYYLVVVLGFVMLYDYQVDVTFSDMYK
jgi:hypothetical protein